MNYERPTAWEWIRKNLFNTWYNGLLTLVCLGVIYLVMRGLWGWATEIAEWQVVQVNLRLFFAGRFPASQLWRLWLGAGVAIALSSLTWTSFIPARRWSWIRGVALILAGTGIALLPLEFTVRLWLAAIVATSQLAVWAGRQWQIAFKRGLSLAWVLSFPAILWLIGGGLGLEPVSSEEWKGLLLTLLVAAASILLSFPMGVLLALGRQSNLSVVRWFCILYIEIVRGLPLIAILFVALNLLSLFLPPGPFRDSLLNSAFSNLLFAIAGLTFFSAAYLAENVRGGLQAVPREQIEAARALGLNPILVVVLIVLPQALRAVIPAIVGQFIGLFKNTALLSIFGFLELTGIARDILAQSEFLGRYQEVYLFIGLIYWSFCYAMSSISQRLEKQLAVS